MKEVKLSSKHQIVIPQEARTALGVKAGDTMLVVTRGKTVILLTKPKQYSQAPRSGQAFVSTQLREPRTGKMVVIRRLASFLQQHHKIGLDTNVFIFQVEENPTYV